MADLSTGSVFAGHRIDGQIGKGGMGVVYRATDIRLDRPVALKVVAAEYAQDGAFAARFKRESRLAASLDHPNVIPIYHAGEEDGLLYVTMRFVEGTDLAEVLKRDKRLDPQRAVAITAQIAAALDAAHARGLVHRDVKPANVLLQDEHVFLTDFGLSKHMSSETGLTESGTFMGTVDYMAPEQAQGQETDARSDVYALGCVLFQMLSGRVPFEKPNVMAKLWAQVNELPPRLDDAGDLGAVVERAMEKDPGRRFQSAGELARAAATAAGMPIASATTIKSKPVRKRRRMPVWIPIAAVAAAAIVVAVVALAGGGGSDASKEKPAITALLARLHRGFTEKLCHNDLTADFRNRFFEPRRGQEALNACDNIAGGPPNRKPLVVNRLTIQDNTASARIEVADEPTTFFLVKRGDRWLADDFTETNDRRYQRHISSAIQPSFRITPDVSKFVVGELPLKDADGVPAKAVGFLEGAVKQIEGLTPPKGTEDIHQRLLAAMRLQLHGARAALAAQKAGDEKAFKAASLEVFDAIKALGPALEDLDRAQ